MIYGLITFSIRHRTLVVLAALACAVAGVYAAVHSPMDAVPDLSENQVIVFSNWPGHGPREVEEQVTYPLSLQIQGLQGVRVVRGSSDIGYSMLHVIFDDHVTFGIARQRVQERLSSLETSLPDGVVSRLAPDGIPTGQIYWYTVEGICVDLAELRSLQDWTIGPQLRSVEGVAEVASVGGFVSELNILVDPEIVSAYGLTIHELADELSRPTSSIGGHVLQKGNAEFVVQLNASQGSSQQVKDWEQRRIPLANGESIPLADIAKVAWGPAVRRGMFEKDGSEMVAGIVHLRYGHNTLDVTQRVKQRLREIGKGLPSGVRIIPCYDRTPLIVGAVGTVTRALVEALLVAAVCVLLVLRHFRAWLVIALTLPLSVLGTFLCMRLLNAVGWIDIQTNIMSLSGIVISIGVLIDSSIVVTENVMHRLRQRFGDAIVQGNIDDTIEAACHTVGWPVFCSILVMLVSFAPVFALGGIDGRMYHPLAWTKSLALICVAILAVTLVPALCSFLVRGHIRDESESAIVRGVIGVYRPMLSWLMDKPDPLIFLLCATFVLAAIPLGNDVAFRSVLFVSLVVLLGRSMSHQFVWRGLLGALSLIVIGLVGQGAMRPCGIEMRLPLDEGMVMDMPITIPRASITQSGDDLKARNMILCRFPEVNMVTGKAGRADTPFDPAPLDMIETMIEFRTHELWPKRRLLNADAERMTVRILKELADDQLIESISHETRRKIVEAALFRYDTIQRETTYQLTEAFQHQFRLDLSRFAIDGIGRELYSSGRLNRALQSSDVSVVMNDLPAQLSRELTISPIVESIDGYWEVVLAGLDRLRLIRQANDSNPVPSGDALNFLRQIGESFGFERSTAETRVLSAVKREHRRCWLKHVAELNFELHRRAPKIWMQLVSEEAFSRGKLLDPNLAEVYSQIIAARTVVQKPNEDQSHHGSAHSALPLIDPHPRFDAIRRRLIDHFSKSLLLWQHDSTTLAAFGGEMDQVLQMPGWTNVWTRPIQNRVDMLATGVNAEIGVRVLGRNLDSVVQSSEEIAVLLRGLTGAADVVADPVRGKGLIQVTPDPKRLTELGVSPSDLQSVLETALSGQIVSRIIDGRERKSVRLRIASQSSEEDEETIRRLPIPSRPTRNTEKVSRGLKTVQLGAVATVEVSEGPATIKSENGWLRNYVRLNVRNRSPFDLIDEARREVAKNIRLPPGVFIEWTGQFEHAEKTRQTLLVLIPAVIAIIFGMLYVTYRDWTDAGLMLLSAPGALAGGILCQWFLGYKFSIAVGVGYIACFGMAASTGIVMLVYLREAVDLAGGLERMTLPELKRAVLTGSVHRLRPKLLTEATTILGLAPMLWSTGIGAEVIRPMAAPVLGGILIADEVIDLLIPVLFYHVRKRRWFQLHPDIPPDDHEQTKESLGRSPTDIDLPVIANR